MKQRSYQKELLDRDDIPFEDIKRNMQELDFINRNLGGHEITLDGIVAIIQKQVSFHHLQIVEIGCGGGDNLAAIKQWAAHVHLPVRLSGIDINPDCIHFAREQPKNAGIDFFCSDYRDFQFEQKPDIIFSSLFCHHFHEKELVEMLDWMRQHCTLGFFINDLHRHFLAYYSIKMLTWLFSKSYLVKNDAPLSVKRGFKRKEWEDLFEKAGIASYNCHWRWAFRWLIVYTHDC